MFQQALRFPSRVRSSSVYVVIIYTKYRYDEENGKVNAFEQETNAKAVVHFPSLSLSAEALFPVTSNKRPECMSPKGPAAGLMKVVNWIWVFYWALRG